MPKRKFCDLQEKRIKSKSLDELRSMFGSALSAGNNNMALKLLPSVVGELNYYYKAKLLTTTVIFGRGSNKFKLKWLKILFSHGARIQDRCWTWGVHIEPVLTIAIERSLPSSIIRLLLENGANPNELKEYYCCGGLESVINYFASHAPESLAYKSHYSSKLESDKIKYLRSGLIYLLVIFGGDLAGDSVVHDYDLKTKVMVTTSDNKYNLNKFGDKTILEILKTNILFTTTNLYLETRREKCRKILVEEYALAIEDMKSRALEVFQTSVWNLFLPIDICNIIFTYLLWYC